MLFFDRLEQRARDTGTLLCIGLDPHPEDLPENTAQGAQEFCINIIRQTQDFALAFKANSAFFEAFGADGIQALNNVIAAIPPDIPVILDAKRGDISSTARAYNRAFLNSGAQAITLNPYLGQDAIQPFLESKNTGIFLLCKTSNPSATTLQDLAVGEQGTPLYLHIANQSADWAPPSRLGLVVGATQVEALEKIRTLCPKTWLLCPGVGAQGASLNDALKSGLRNDGLGILLSVSRGISQSTDARKAAQELTVDIKRAQKQKISQPEVEMDLPEHLHNLATALIEAECVKFGTFTLKSGLQSPIYIDLRRLIAYPRLLQMAAEAYIPLLTPLNFDHIAALPYAAMPIATAISLIGEFSMVYPRKETKDYGTGATVEGVFADGDHVVVIDDLATTGTSKFEGFQKLESVKLSAQHVVVLIDRQSGASEALLRSGYQLHAVFTFGQLLNFWQREALVKDTWIEAARNFIQGSNPPEQ